MIFIIGDDNVLSVCDSEDRLHGECEGLDVENGIYRFYDETGQPMTPIFYEPNRTGKYLGFIRWSDSGKYRLVPSRKKDEVDLADALASVVAIEENPYFSTIEEVREFLATNNSEKMSLNKNSKMECTRHGLQKPAFICKHLQHGENIGFFVPEEEPDPEWPFKNAWCAECESVATEQGGWDEVSESFAQIMPICEGCYEEIKQRNT